MRHSVLSIFPGAIAPHIAETMLHHGLQPLPNTRCPTTPKRRQAPHTAATMSQHMRNQTRISSRTFTCRCLPMTTSPLADPVGPPQVEASAPRARADTHLFKLARGARATTPAFYRAGLFEKLRLEGVAACPKQRIYTTCWAMNQIQLPESKTQTAAMWRHDRRASTTTLHLPANKETPVATKWPSREAPASETTTHTTLKPSANVQSPMGYT